MELVEGGTLAEVLKAKGRLSWEEVVEYGIQICDALQHAHEHGIVHRDLKPENVVVRRDGYAKVLDFGLSQTTDQHSQATSGTLGYMAPEVLKQKYDFKCDIWSCGMRLM